MISIIVALTKNHVIGKDNQLPWHIPEDLEHFKKTTSGGTVVMGRKTWDSIPEKYRPLPNRKNIVISRSMPLTPGIDVCRSIPEAIEKAQSYGKDIFIVGGANIYQQTIDIADTMYLSYVKKEVDGDAFFPKFNKDEWQEVKREDFADFELVVLKRRDAQ